MQPTRLRRARRTPPAPAPALIYPMGESTDILTDALRPAMYEVQGTRDGHYLHVSDLLSKCIRKRVMCKRMSLAMPSRRLTMSDMLTFAQGDAIHDLLKDRARIAAPNMVWGRWSCKCGSLEIQDPCVHADIEQETCPHCLTQINTYHEVSMRDEELWIVGNPDLILWLPDAGAFHITELKSIADKAFKELVRPKPEHVQQVVFYWYLMNKLGYPLTDKVSIFYASKGWGVGSVTKEFVIDPQHEIARLDDMLEDARAYRQAYEDDSAPLPVRLCPNMAFPEAKACSIAIPCFEI